MAGAPRLFLHAMVVPNAGPDIALLQLMKDAVDRYPIAAWKCYTQWGPNGRGFTLDSPDIGINGARVYGIDVPQRRRKTDADPIGMRKAAYRAAADPTFETYGSKTDAEYDALIAERSGLPA